MTTGAGREHLQKQTNQARSSSASTNRPDRAAYGGSLSRTRSLDTIDIDFRDSSHSGESIWIPSIRKALSVARLLLSRR